MSPSNLKPEVLWHYCSNDSLVSIVKSKSIRLSSLSLSNDYMEGKLIQSLLKEEVRKQLGPNFNHKVLERVFLVIEAFTDGLGFCLSEEPDLLSQWRGYADNAQGVSIGFSRKELSEKIESLEVKDTVLERVSYSKKAHEEILRPIVQKIIELFNNGLLSEPKMGGLLVENPVEKFNDEMNNFQLAHQEIARQLILIKERLFLVKSEAFSEENEWRILRINDKKYTEADFYSRGSTIVPYTLLDLPCNSIREIILGPKNNTPPDVVKMMLENNGFKTTSVKISEASYR